MSSRAGYGLNPRVRTSNRRTICPARSDQATLLSPLGFGLSVGVGVIGFHRYGYTLPGPEFGDTSSPIEADRPSAAKSTGLAGRESQTPLYIDPSEQGRLRIRDNAKPPNGRNIVNREGYGLGTA